MNKVLHLLSTQMNAQLRMKLMQTHDYVDSTKQINLLILQTYSPIQPLIDLLLLFLLHQNYIYSLRYQQILLLFITK